MTSIHDVAKLAGVAPITVARVINQSVEIQPETRERVEKAIARLGYVPSLQARSQNSNRKQMLALILTDITNPFFTTLARGVEDTASAYGYTVIFCNTDESIEKEKRYLNILLDKQVDGFLLIPAKSQTETIEMIQSHEIPVVLLDRRVPHVNVDVVRCDSEEGAYQLTSHLLSLGHRQIAMLSGPSDVSTAEDRVAGYRRALREAGVEEKEEYILRGHFTQESGYAMTKQVLSLQLRPSALLAANNFITIGAMKALHEYELDVPEDIAVAGFDDLPPTLVTVPFFTVASQPAYKMGSKATERLLERIEIAEDLPPEEFILPTQLMIRQSSGDPLG